jgi:hypothetical protein
MPCLPGGGLPVAARRVLAVPAGTNSGGCGGGGGAGVTNAAGGRWGRRRFVEHLYTSLAASYAYSVGTTSVGGTAGTNGAGGGNGAAGYIVVQEYA